MNLRSWLGKEKDLNFRLVIVAMIVSNMVLWLADVCVEMNKKDLPKASFVTSATQEKTVMYVQRAIPCNKENAFYLASA